MTTLRRAILVLCSLLLASAALAADPWDGPPFSADPKALVAAAEASGSGTADLVMLLDELRYTFQADGSCRYEARYVYYVATQRGVQNAATISASWAPWYEEKPAMAARVALKDGTTRMLDPNSVTEAAAPEQPDIFTDEKVIRAPLPGVEPGSVVEMLITHNARNVFPGSGKNGEFLFGRAYVPVLHARLILDGPSSFAPHIVNKSPNFPTISEKDGRKQWVFEGGRTNAITDREDYLPSDEISVPYVAFSTGTTWSDIAKNYSEIVDKQIAAGDVRDVVGSVLAGAKEPKEKIAKLLDYVEKNVHYEGVEVAEGSIIPRVPKGVLSNKFGDCKDKATLLVALLRAAGIPSHVVLLEAGLGFDAMNELPGLSRFNHAIVVTDGANSTWIDPTDEFARAGELPIPDQGRMVLIAAPGTTSLTRTPEAPSSANVYTEMRTFTLPEDGKAHVVEVTKGTAFHDAQLRRIRASANVEKYEESLKDYAKNYYNSSGTQTVTASDAHDMAKPFTLTIAVTSSKAGMVANGDGAVAVDFADLAASATPQEMRNYREAGAGQAADTTQKPRVHDFVFPVPTVKERVYRIVPPPGYAARTLPHDETKHLGTATLTKTFKTEPDGTVVATFRFDTGKRRITASEFEQTRVEVSKFLRTDTLVLGFDSIGQAKLNAGDVGGAITEFRRLAALHPKEAQHHIDISRALRAGGLGEAARAEARRAVEIEPSSAHAHANLAAILEHDLLGREFRNGFDLEGAIAELRKAKELDPNDPEIRAHLAEALSYGDDGVRFSPTAKLDQSIKEFQSMLDDLGKDGKPVESQLMLVLLHAGRIDDVKKHIETVEDPEQQKLFRILIADLTDGSAAALKELSQYDTERRRGYAVGVGATLLEMHRYKDAAAMYQAANEGTATASDMRPLIDVMKRTQHLDYAADATPKGLATQVITALLAENLDAVKKLFPSDAAENLKLETFDLGARNLGMKDFPLSVATDIVAAMIEVQTDGNDTTGYRVRVRIPAATSSDVMTLLMTHDNGKYAIVAVMNDIETLARGVAKLADAGKLDAARTWLNWTRELLSARGGDDPLAGPPFAMVWPKEKATATADEIRFASAILYYGVPNGMQTLTAAREKAPDDRKVWIDEMLAAGHLDKEEYAKANEITERLLKAHPDSEWAFGAYTSGLILADKPQAAEALANERLKRLPHDAAALRTLYAAAAKRHDYAAAGVATKKMIEELTPTPADYNNAAWLALFSGKDLDQALDYAHRASNGENASTAASLHTLAALYAATGKSVDAREALLKSMELRFSDAPKPYDWYVLGRIAENYGVRDAALAAYKRVEKDKDDASGLSTFELAQIRLAAMK